MLHACQELPVDLSDTPATLQMRLELVFSDLRHACVADYLDEAEFDGLVGQQTERPLAVTRRRIGAGQGRDLGTCLTGEDRWAATTGLFPDGGLPAEGFGFVSRVVDGVLTDVEFACNVEGRRPWSSLSRMRARVSLRVECVPLLSMRLSSVRASSGNEKGWGALGMTFLLSHLPIASSCFLSLH